MKEGLEAFEEPFELREREVEAEGGKARLAFVVCRPLERAGFLNAFSTRLGGVSPLPEGDLNLSHFRGDEAANVAENRRRFLQAIGAPGATIVAAKQTHSTERAPIATMEEAKGPAPEADALTTRLRGVLLSVQTADCLPVLIADTKSGVMAVVHAGWRGTAGRIVERTMADLMNGYGVNPKSCIAALGPSACADCYEIGEDVIEVYKKQFGYWRKLIVNFKEGGKAHLDVRAANYQQLVFCGFDEENIHMSDYCTMHQNDLFFSHRREGQKMPAGTGRLLSVIGRF